MATAFTDQDVFYNMDARPKGICLIINNFEFEQSRRLDTGPADKKNLMRTFEKLDFKVKYFENQTCAQMKTCLQDIQKKDHTHYDCFVCCISSHGNKKGVYGADDHTVNISELQKYFYSTECPSLAGKPKVFFVDACRGGEGQKGHFLTREDLVITPNLDIVLSIATTSDKVSYTNPDSTKGSVYFYHLARLLELYAKSKTLMQILHKLNEALTKESKGHTAAYLSTLSKELLFYYPVPATMSAPVLKPAREPPVTQPPGPTHPQAFRFHDKHGAHVELSNYNHTADYRGQSCDGGIVMSCDPMEIYKQYEVQITQQHNGVGKLPVGVVTSSPNTLPPLMRANCWQSAVVVESDRLFDRGLETPTVIGQALNELALYNYVGVSLDSSRRLHLHMNGDDLGVVPCRPLPDPCWALWELNSAYTEVKTRPVKTAQYQN